MIKYLFLPILLTAITINVSSQNIQSLKRANSCKELNDSTSIIYGSFIQRLGSSSWSLPQEIRLLNIVMDETYTFSVKPMFKSSKENSFCYCIKPGIYKILNYFWVQAKWSGFKEHEEPIFKDIDKLKSYYIDIRPNSTYYLGTWHFKTSVVSFSNDKINLDQKLKKEYKEINFDEAVTKLPE